MAEPKAFSTTSASQAEVVQAIWEREMRRLSVITRLLGTVLLALGARMLVTGPTLSSAVTAGVTVILLLAAILLTRRGRKLKPASSLRQANADNAPAKDSTETARCAGVPNRRQAPTIKRRTNKSA